ncbi:MAG: putative anti-sigma regulatory factor, serine/threonine protein kinase [Xanthobacteraceae bacterium]|jgi:serine/threonine-protein kinase RsbW|nr:putative anti-sigma regulatory factor, serine/threonine protein kinase [Xanthobacteraceae bacterium]
MVCVNDGFGPGAADDTLALAVRLDELPRAAAWLESLAAREGWPERTLFTLQLGLEEALVNVISYGFPEPAPIEATIALAYRRDRGMALLRISDNGAPFDPTTIDEPDIPEDVEHAAIGGHGVQLMRHLLDEFSYCHADGNNQLILGSRLPDIERTPQPA